MATETQLTDERLEYLRELVSAAPANKGRTLMPSEREDLSAFLDQLFRLRGLQAEADKAEAEYWASQPKEEWPDSY